MPAPDSHSYPKGVHQEWQRAITTVHWPISVPLSKSKVGQIHRLARSFRIIEDAAAPSVASSLWWHPQIALLSLSIEWIDNEK